MEYRRYFAVFRRYFFMIMLLTSIAGLSSAYFALRQPNLYVATTTLLINPANPNAAIDFLSSSLSSGGAQGQLQQLASTYDVYLKSSSFDRIVRDKLQSESSSVRKLTDVLGPNAIGSEISTELVGITNFYRISVTDTNSIRAEILANTVAREFVAQNTSTLQVNQGLSNPGSDANRIAILQKQIEALNAQLTKLQTGPDAQTPANIALVSSLAASSASFQSTLDGLTARSPSAENSAKQIEAATVPFAPAPRHVTRDISLGIVGGLILGLLAAFLLDYLDYAVRSPEDVEAATGKLPMAVISLVGSRRRGSRRTLSSSGSLPLTGGLSSTAEHSKLFAVENPRDPVSEAFRALRTNLAFSNLGRPIRTLLVTSVLPSEGKTTVAANLAVVLAQSGRRVILVDSDLRRPSLHRVFGLHKATGFSDLLLMEGRVEQSLQATGIPNLRVLTSGSIPPNPAELLSSDAVGKVIDELMLLSDIVVFDTPPMGALTDAVVLATKVDGVLTVVRSGSSRPNVVKKGLEALLGVHAHPLGIVLNMVDISSLRDYSYYYYYSQSGDYGEASRASKAEARSG